MPAAKKHEILYLILIYTLQSLVPKAGHFFFKRWTISADGSEIPPQPLEGCIKHDKTRGK